MRLVDREQADRCVAEQLAEMPLARAFGRDVEQIEFAAPERVDRGLAVLLAVGAVRLAARIPLACALRNWSCIKAISGEITTQVPVWTTAGN